MKSVLVLALVLSTLACLGAQGADPVLRIQCTPALMALTKDLLRPLREKGIELKMVEAAGNTQVVNALSEGTIDIALITRRMKMEELVSNPAMHYREAILGTHVAAVVVSRPVWESGVHALTHDQILKLYENKFRSWKDVGGEDRPMVFFEPAHERGPWEMFATWLYGDIHQAPGVAWQVVADGADTQNTLQFASGGISVASLRWADRVSAFPLALINDAGQPVEPSNEHIADGTYPLMRPLVVVFPQEPAAEKRKLLEFLVGEKGQKIVGAHDFVPQSEITGPLKK